MSESHIDIIFRLFPDRLIQPETRSDLPKKRYMVYIVTVDGNCIVLGHGQSNRARIIFDKADVCTCHVKAFTVRLHHLYSNGRFGRFIIPCDDKMEAKMIEAELHKAIRWREVKISPSIIEAVLLQVEHDPTAAFILKLAMGSYFDGIADLISWRKKGLIDNPTWASLEKALRLSELKKVRMFELRDK